MQSGQALAAVEADVAAVEAYAIGEQQLKRMQSGSSSRSRRNRGAVGNRGVETDKQLKWTPWNGEQQLKQIDSIGEQQLKRTRSWSSSSAQRAVWRRRTHVGERGGSS